MPLTHSPSKSGSDTNLLGKDKDTNQDFLHTISTRSKRKRTDEDLAATIENELKSFKTEIMAMLTTWKQEDDYKQNQRDEILKEIKNSTQELEKSMDFISSQYEEMSIKINGLEQKTKMQDEMISTLRSEIENLHRESKKSYLEIRNVPAETNETKQTLTTSVVTLCKTINVEVSPADIRDIYRIPGKRDANKPVIVELSTKEKKLSILKTSKIYNMQHKTSKLNASHLGFKQTSPIYVSDHLTPYANRLFFLARDLTKSNLYKYSWSSMGKVFIKKSDDTPAILIKNEEQLLELKSK